MTPHSPEGNVSKPDLGSLTLTLREGDELNVVTAGGEQVTIYVAKTSSNRVSLNIRAPLDVVIERQR